MSNADPREVIADRGGVWPVPFDRAERVLLTNQAKYDRRSIPALWLWRLLRPEDGPGSTAPDEVLYTSPRVSRRYAEPIAVHLYLDWTPQKKGKRGPVVETTGTQPIELSRAEARRLGRVVGASDDVEGLFADTAREDLVYIPRAGDLVRALGRYYAVQQLAPEWWGASRIIAKWKGTAAEIRDDSSAPGLGSLVQPATVEPPLPEGVPWQG